MSRSAFSSPPALPPLSPPGTSSYGIPFRAHVLRDLQIKYKFALTGCFARGGEWRGEQEPPLFSGEVHEGKAVLKGGKRRIRSAYRKKKRIAHPALTPDPSLQIENHNLERGERSGMGELFRGETTEKTKKTEGGNERNRGTGVKAARKTWTKKHPWEANALFPPTFLRIFSSESVGSGGGYSLQRS